MVETTQMNKLADGVQRCSKTGKIELDLTYPKHCSQTFEVSPFKWDNNHTDELGYSASISEKMKTILYGSLLNKLCSQEVGGQILQ